MSKYDSMQNGVITNDRMKPESNTGYSTLKSSSFKVANAASISKGKKQYHIEMSRIKRYMINLIKITYQLGILCV